MNTIWSLFYRLPMPTVLPGGQLILPVQQQQQQQQPLLNGPVPAGVTPTVGVDLTTSSGPSTSEAHSYGAYGRPRECLFLKLPNFHTFLFWVKYCFIFVEFYMLFCYLKLGKR